MSTLSLRPCPFCGGVPTVQPWHGGRPTKKLISCSNGDYYDEDGGCSVGPSVCGETEEEAAAAWNRRAHGEKLTPDEAWTELCETPDITSPEEYPDHALITIEQLRSFIERATTADTALPIAVRPGRDQLYSCLPCTWSASDVDCCTYPADKIYVDGAGTRFCAECAGEFRGGTQHMRKLSVILSRAEPHLNSGIALPKGDAT